MTTETTTPAATHLARLAELVQYLKDEGDRQLHVAAAAHTCCKAVPVPNDLSNLDRWAESVRWLIEDRS